MGKMQAEALENVEIRPKLGKTRTIAIIIVSVLILACMLFAGYIIKKKIDYQRWIEHMTQTVEVPTFYHGIRIDDIDMGGLTYEEGKTSLEEMAKDRLEQIRFVLVYGDKQWNFTYKDINAEIDWDKKIDQAYEVAREGELEERYNRVRAIETNGIKLNTSLSYNIDELKDDLEAIANEINYEPVDADIKFFPDRKEKFEITEEKSGLFIDMEEVFNIIKQRMESREYGELVLEPQEVPANVTKAKLQKATYRIAQFSTNIASSSANRKHNVRLALNKINGYRINPGETFSFNNSVGPRTAKSGFKPAPVIMPDKSMKDDHGGGVCQSSTTIYNAALRADLEIVERYHHSFPVGYIPKGLDATVAYGGADLKFKNNRDTPVFLRTFSSGDNVFVEVYGEAFPNNGEIKCTSTVTSVIPAPKPKLIADKKGNYVKEPGAQKEHVKSRNGYKVTSYKTYYENGKKIWTKVIAHDYYRPIQGIIYYRPK